MEDFQGGRRENGLGTSLLKFMTAINVCHFCHPHEVTYILWRTLIVKLIVFSVCVMLLQHQMAEKYLKANGNDLGSTVGDLLALGVVPEDGSLMGANGGGRPIKKQPGLVKGLPGTNHYFGRGTGSLMGLGTPPGGGAPAIPGIKDLYHQQLLQTHPTLHLLQMQQHYMALPSATVLGFQQLLNNQMSQLRTCKQQVMQQLQALKAQAGGNSAQHQQIAQLQQRLMLISQLMTHISQQQKYPKDKSGGGMLDGMVKSVTPGAVGSQPLGRHAPPSRNKDMKGPGSLAARSISLPGGAHEHSLSLGMQGMSMNGHVTPSSISQSSARSVSRLQQIISGSADDGTGHQDNKTKFRFPPQSLASTPAEMYSSTSSPLAYSGTTTTTPASTPFSPARSFTDIQEFRPGVPWQPRALPTEPAQLYANPGGSVSRPELRTVQSEPVFPQYGGNTSHPPVGQQRRPPSLNYNPPPSSGYRGRSSSSDQQSGWQHAMAPGSTNTPSPYRVPQTPDSAFSSGTPITRRQQGPPPPHSSSFNPAGRGLGQPLSRPNALFPSPHSFSQAPGRPPSTSSSSSTSSDMRWGSSSRGKFPSSSGSSSGSSSSGSGPPPASLTSSSSMWDSSVGPSSGIPSSWSSLGLDTASSSSNNNNGFAVTPASATEPGFSSPPPPPRTSCSSLTPGLSGTWDKRGLESPKSAVLSPEPTFAEWKSGKKAHFKLPSNPPSSWLCLYNIYSQVYLIIGGT
jgi:hypothetical protein